MLQGVEIQVEFTDDSLHAVRIAFRQKIFEIGKGLNRAKLPRRRDVHNDRLVIAYMPLGQGLLTGSRRPRRNGARLVRRFMGTPSWSRTAPLRSAVAEVAAAHGASMAQVALAWLVAQPNVVAIPGARTIAQLEENVAAADLELTADELERLGAASAAVAR